MSVRLFRASRLAAFLVTSACAVSPFVAGSAFAAEEAQAFAIPAQPLAEALTQFARDAHMQILFPADAIAQRKSPELKGTMTRQAALARLLSGSGLFVRRDDGRTIVLGKAEGGDPDAPAASAPETSAADDIIVTGTREKAQTVFTALSPVDTFSGEQVHSTVTSRLDETLAQLVPSFVVKRQPASDGPEFVRPASLDGLSPDMTLVMVNGKRFHRTAFLNNSNGAQPMDLAQIPAFSIGHIEVLRDGASAQYGSDAIAGVINIMLDTKPGFSTYVQGSQYYKGDGTQEQFGGRAGFVLPGGGYLVLTGEYSNAEATSRSHQREDAAEFEESTGIAVRDPVTRWGNPEMRTAKFALNAAEPVGEDMELYAFGTFGKSSGWSDINWRNPSTTTSVYGSSSAFPDFDVSSIYPGGFTPSEGIKATDFQGVTGLRGGEGKAFSWDLSGSFGGNSTEFYLDHSINASLGPDSPLNFYLGREIEQEFDLNADGVWQLDTPILAQPITIAFGAERRDEMFRVRAGEYASYAVGDGAADGLAAGANGFPGFSPEQAGSWDQVSYAGYLDVTVPLTSAWTLEGAARDEYYDTFGNSFTYKLATRYEVAPFLALRGSYSTGFKAPTPAQLYSTSTSQGLDTTTLLLYTTGRLSPTDPISEYFGGKALTPETSKAGTFGLTWRTRSGLSGSIDAYQIDVDNRFSVSSSYTITDAIAAELEAQGVSDASDYSTITFFTNDYDTRTRGIDFVVSYKHKVGPGLLDATASYSYTRTKVLSGSVTESDTTRVKYEKGLPEHNAVATINYTLGRFTVMARGRYYGAWTDSSGNSTGDIFQRFGGMAFFDAGLTFALSGNVDLRIGAENIFDTYPDKATYQYSRGLVYSRNSPYDTNGGNYYLRMDMAF